MKQLLLAILGVFLFSTTHAQTDMVGHWNFDDPTQLTKAEVGRDLVLRGNHQAVAGPDSADGAVRIGVGSYYICPHGLSPSGGGSRVNEFSLVMDIKVPQIGQWYCMYQANFSNNDDGEWFISPSGQMGVGATGYTPDPIAANVWYRIGIAVKNGYRYDYYIDGKKELVGSPGSIDGRFSLDTAVLLFADENQEDNMLDVADIKIFSRALSDSEMKALGGYHEPPPPEPAEPDTLIYPYLQSPTPNSIYICWHALISTESKVEYGLTDALGSTATGGAHVFEDTTTWHWVKLTDLQPETFYYYKAITDTMESEIYRFKTPPVYGNKSGHIRFSVFGDTRTVPDQFSKVVAALKEKVLEMYGGTIEENLNVMLHVGDVVTHGNILKQYKREYFGPLAQVTANVPMMVSIGDHEHDADNYYQYMKYEDFAGPEGEYYYAFQYGRVLFVAVHSIHHTETQLQWLDELLQNAESDTTIDWIFAFTHRPGHSEIWPDGNESYMQNHVIPILNKYSKADLVVYGHSHNYERGQVFEGNLRLMLNGGGGSALDRWRMYSNQTEYPEIQKSYDYYCYTIFDIDVKNKSYHAYSYSLGHKDKPMDNVLFDEFFRNKADETPPNRPSLISPQNGASVAIPVSLQASPYAGKYEILSSQFQVTREKGNYTAPVLDVKRDFENIYYDTGAPNFIPVDLNAGIDLTKYTLDNSDMEKTYWWRVRYRDRNLQWSEWSEEQSFIFSSTKVNSKTGAMIKESKLYRNYPNPFNPSTIIEFDVCKPEQVNLKIYSLEGKLVKTLIERHLNAGRYSVTWDGTDEASVHLPSGTYFFQLTAGEYRKVRKAVLIK